MPCIFCLAVFAMLAGAITTAVLDQMEGYLATVATEPVRRTVDSDSVAKLETSVLVPGAGGRTVPVNVTVYKKHKRVRIQVMTHDVTRAEAEAVEDAVSRALGLRIVDRSDAHDEAKVRAAFGQDELARELTAESGQEAMGDSRSARAATGPSPRRSHTPRA